MDEIRRRVIRDRAELFRSNCRTGRYGIVDLFKECERMGYKLIRYPLSEIEMLGFSTVIEGDIVIYTNSDVRLAREIFTLAHEIGHVNLHFSDSKRFLDNAKTISDSDEDELEKEANYFAVQLLMPYDRLKSFWEYEVEKNNFSHITPMDVAMIMSEFCVSFEMVVNSLENYGLIGYKERNRLNTQKNEIKVGNLLRSVGGNGRLNISTKEVSVPYEYIKYAIYNYNHNAIPMDTLKEVLNYCNLTVEDIDEQLVHDDRQHPDLESMIGRLID